MGVTYITKVLAALSSAGLGGISTAGTPVTTINSSAMDTARRITLFATAASTSYSVIITGTIEGGGTKTEVLIGSTTANVQVNSIWDYTNLISAVGSSAPNIPVWFGTSSIAGTPWRLTDGVVVPQELSGYLVFSTTTAAVSAKFDITLDDPTFLTARTSVITVPSVFNSTSVVGVAVSSAVIGQLAVNAYGAPFPVTAWRMTMASSATGAGTVTAAVMQAGV